MEISRQDEPAIKFPLSVLDELKEPAPPAVSSPAQLAELAMQEDEWVDWTDGHEPEHDEEPGAELPQSPPQPEPANETEDSSRWLIHSPESKAQLVVDFVAAREEDPTLSQRSFAESRGVSQSLVSVSLREAGVHVAEAARKRGLVRKVWTDKERDQIAGEAIEALDAGTTTMSQFARKHGIVLSTLSHWLKDARKKRDYQKRAAKRMETMGLAPKSEKTETTTLLSRPSPPPSSPLPPAPPGRRRSFTEAERKNLLAQVRGLSAAQAGKRLNLSPSLVIRWRNLHGEAHRGRVSASQQQPAAQIETTTSPPKRANGARTFENVSEELQSAIRRVSDLKRELRDLLAD
jgi:transposase